ncbi:peroxisomal and mitochondrial division factor 2 [Ipomoea triloba]|uniref:peroxisomal and mitochondrial division factor 2 n=1 Tax=Ipomoea triloba TaxID=35885 RepID=UPI00125E6901|nr:peroxisomal and mitochondrial division factor 2 [Ipomoea triloba]
MADESATNGDVFIGDAEIGANDDSQSESKTSVLSQKLAASEKENRELVRENEVVKEIEEKLKKTIEKLESERAELRKKVEKSGTENRALGSVAARASELEGEVVRLQHDLITATNGLAEANSEVSQLKAALDGLKTSEEEKRLKLEAVEGERNLLIEKLTKLESSENDHRAEMEAKEQVNRVLTKKIQDLVNASLLAKGLDKEKEELRKRLDELEKMKTELEEKLEEKERLITEKTVHGSVNGIKDCHPGLKMEWPVIAGSAVATIAAVSVVFYLHQRKA